MDDPEIDVTGWLVTDLILEAHQLFGETAQFSFERYVDAWGTAIMDKISSASHLIQLKNVEFYKNGNNTFAISIHLPNVEFRESITQR